MTTASEPSKQDEKPRGPNIWPIKPKPEHTVKVGNMEYPAHPYTVHVSNLSSDTMEMDLYDLFRPKCGPIVHVRIFREKAHGREQAHDHIPNSKGAGLIQFEERESVEKALELSGEVGLHEKLIVVTRSNQPAVSIVPPGMHRVNPKGHGKNSARNLKRKERRMRSASKATALKDVTASSSTNNPTLLPTSPSHTNSHQDESKHMSQEDNQNESRDNPTNLKDDKPQVVADATTTRNATHSASPPKTTTATGDGRDILAFRPRNVRKPVPATGATGPKRKKKLGI